MGQEQSTRGLLSGCLLAVAVIAGISTAAVAGDNKLALSGSATITTDYVFRSISNTNQKPAVQPEFDLSYGMVWAYVWGSNTAFGDNIELDYGAGISPKWRDITFALAMLVYTYPGANNEIDYFEVKTGATWASGPWTVGMNNYWSPDNSQFFGNSDAIEGTLSYALSKKLWNFFLPSLSGQVGFQSYEINAPDYVYWNAGLTLGFLDHWSADIRYYDTNYDDVDCLAQSGGRHNCDARAVGTIKATF
jgi:uncharacterized protein (TIGR02001 family)